MPTTNSPIVLLDSGLGGLTVARALRARLPHEQIIYFGDTARLPYGSKSPATVQEFVRQIINYVAPLDPKHVLIACNTASALAIEDARRAFPHLRISGVLEPGARAAVAAAGDLPRPLIGIIGTEATIRSRAYERAIFQRRARARLLSCPTPLLVPIIEEGRPMDDPIARLAVQQYLAPLVERGIHVLVLGCTHYPIYRSLFEQCVQPGTIVIDSAEMCAQDVQRRLQMAGMIRSAPSDALASADIRCFVTDDSPRFAALARRFLGIAVNDPTVVSLDDLHAANAPAVASLRPAV